jgi:DnaJ-class molecular chaperone
MNKRYNAYNKTYIALEEGQEFCRTCGGSGLVRRAKFIKTSKFPKVPNNTMLVCHHCLGSGKIDWIEKAVGKKAE